MTPAEPTPTTPAWLELTVQVDQEAAEAVADMLARHGNGAGVVTEATPPPDAAPDEAGVPYPLEQHPAYPVTLRTYLPFDDPQTIAQTEQQVHQIEQALWHLGQLRPVGALHRRVLHEEDWANTWKQFYPVQRIGQHTVIVPSWLDYSPLPADVVLWLDPGMAFGTGLHPTTQLCLCLLEAYARPGLRMLDLGTGSAILAIAAARQGVAPVLALDNDPAAVAVAHENVAHNHVEACVTVALGSLQSGLPMRPWPGGTPEPVDTLQQPDQTSVPPPYSLVVANIIAHALITLAADLAAVLAPGGILISSGILSGRETEVARALEAAGLQPVQQQQQDDWFALVHRRSEEERIESP